MATFSRARLISKRQFRSPTGVEADTFRKLVERPRPNWRERIAAPKNRSGHPWGGVNVSPANEIAHRASGRCFCNESIHFTFIFKINYIHAHFDRSPMAAIMWGSGGKS